jgi:hypothetical protein
VFHRNVVIGMLALAALAVPGAVEAATRIGEVVAVVGSPTASGPGGSRGLKKGSEVFEDDTVKVSSGNAQIILDDGTRIVVGPSSSLLLDQYVKRGKVASKVTVKALRGTYRFITGKSPKSAYRISTAHATIGIRGTGFDYWVKAKTGVVVLQGAVRMNGIAGGSVDVNSGCQMGEATNTTARQLRGTEKNNTIRENLPFIIDQSLLTRRFRLNVSTCNLQAPEGQGSGDQPEPQDNNRNQRDGGGQTP